MRRNAVLIALWIVALVLLGCAGFAVPMDLAIAIVFGWVWYLIRVVPQVGVAWDGVLTAAVCLVLFLAGSHAVLAWLYEHLGSEAEKGDPAPRRWKPRWTAALGLLIVLMFVAGLSTAGIVHQAGWLLTSPEPLVHSGMGAVIRRAISTNNLKGIGLALDNYHAAHRSYPPGGTFDGNGQPLHGWQAMLLPFLEQQRLYDRIDFSVPWDHPRNADAYRTEIPGFLYPSPIDRRDRRGYVLSCYAGNADMLGGDVARKESDVKDGTSSTFMAGEAAGEFQPWGYPANWRDPALGINRSPRGFGGPSPGGANFLFADGSVHFLKNTIDPRVFRALSTPAGGEKVSPGEY